MESAAGVRPLRISESVHLDSKAISAVLLLTGLVLCLGSALGFTRALCVTEGCRLYEGYGFLGLSLHIWGAMAFGTGLALLLFPLGRMSAYRRFLHVCIWAEIALLTWQVLYLPCSECLLVGLIWGLLALVEFRNRVSFKIWSAVFLMALVLMCKGLLHPWPVYGLADAGMQVYFSPSCPGCKSEITKLLAGGEVDHGRVAFFPVVLKPGDYERVETFQDVLKRTLDVGQAFQACWSDKVHSSAGIGEWLRVRYGLLCNRLVLVRMGIHKIPVVVSGSAERVAGVPLSEAGECGFDEGDNCAGDVNHPAFQPDSLQGLRRDIHKNTSGRGFKGGVKPSLVLAQVQADQVEPPESPEQPEPEGIFKQYQHRPEAGSGPQVEDEDGESQGREMGAFRPLEDLEAPEGSKED